MVAHRGMDVYALDPLEDTRWASFVARHPRASVFHSAGWLCALRRTYGFTPIAFTTSPPNGSLENALLFCAVHSRFTGRRLVSLPFSDHCEPLVGSREELHALCSAAVGRPLRGAWRYVELRPVGPMTPPDSFGPAQTFELHRLDLRPDLDTLTRGLHKDSIQRKIRRAEREGLTYEEGRTESLMMTLYRLLELTRQRHEVPPQPLAWFRNLIDCLGEALCIRIVYKDGRPAAGILTLAHGDRLVYKYGGSDAQLHASGAVPFVFWQTILDAKRQHAVELDLGRSDVDNPGLIAFKDHLGAARSPLTYWRTPPPSGVRDGWKVRVARRLFASLPAPVRRATGRLLYPHIA